MNFFLPRHLSHWNSWNSGIPIFQQRDAVGKYKACDHEIASGNEIYPTMEDCQLLQETSQNLLNSKPTQ